MPEKWTGELIGRLHNEGITVKELAAHLKMNPKYLSQILNGHCFPKRAEEKLNAGLDEMIAEREKNNERDC